jgi:hypothetical protein
MALSRAVCLTLFAAAGIAACSSSSGPANTSLLIVGGNQQSDTIGATLPQALQIHAGAHQSVEFQSVPGTCQAYIEGVSEIFDSTDANGNASVPVQLGPTTGTAKIAIRVVGRGTPDTARFTVNPGQLAGISISPSDTAVFVNHAVPLSAWGVDRIGNHRPDAISLTVASGPATVSGKTLTPNDVGRVVVVGSVGAFVDTVYMSAVPPGVIAAAGDLGIVMFNLDGSGLTTVAHVPAVTVRWAPSGTRLVFTPYGNPTGYLEATDLSGNITLLDSSSVYADQKAMYSRDGAWIYLSRMSRANGKSSLWRMHPDGSGLAALALQDTLSAAFPSPSPDGTELAYVADPNGTAAVHVMTLATGAFQTLGLISTDPAWSPTGNTIAIIVSIYAPGPLALTNLEGGGAGLSSSNYFGDFDWSPDGQWLVAADAATGRLDLISASLGTILPLPFTAGQSYVSPTWKPK